jgi:tripartite-type tricarboxylate transporter receptor subunit TctC
MAGLVDIFMTPFGKSHGQLVDEGKLKVVGVLSSERQAMFKKAPTLNESKALKGFVFEMWSGYFVRKDTPEAVVQALHKALSEVANDPAVRAALEAQSMVVPKPLPLTTMNKVYADNIARYRGIAKAINLQAE